MNGVLAAPVAVITSSSGAISPPHIEYGQLSPMLVVFGAAVVGVLVEAFTPRPLRRSIQLVLALASLAVAFVLTIVIAISFGQMVMFGVGACDSYAYRVGTPTTATIML